jgi:valyl-tRNA synthetase
MLTDLTISEKRLAQTGGAVRSTAQFDLRVEYSEPVDVPAESAKLTKDLEGLSKAIASKEKQLGDETFRSRAPEKIIRGLEATLASQRVEMQKLTERLEQLNQNVN